MHDRDSVRVGRRIAVSYCALESQRSNAAPLNVLILPRLHFLEGKSSMAKKKKTETKTDGHLPPPPPLWIVVR